MMLSQWLLLYMVILPLFVVFIDAEIIASDLFCDKDNWTVTSSYGDFLFTSNSPCSATNINNTSPYPSGTTFMYYDGPGSTSWSNYKIAVTVNIVPENGTDHRFGVSMYTDRASGLGMHPNGMIFGQNDGYLLVFDYANQRAQLNKALVGKNNDHAITTQYDFPLDNQIELNTDYEIVIIIDNYHFLVYWDDILLIDYIDVTYRSPPGGTVGLYTTSGLKSTFTNMIIETDFCDKDDLFCDKDHWTVTSSYGDYLFTSTPPCSTTNVFNHTTPYPNSATFMYYDGPGSISWENYQINVTVNIALDAGADALFGVAIYTTPSSGIAMHPNGMAMGQKDGWLVMFDYNNQQVRVYNNNNNLETWYNFPLDNQIELNTDYEIVIQKDIKFVVVFWDDIDIIFHLTESENRTPDSGTVGLMTYSGVKVTFTNMIIDPAIIITAYGTGLQCSYPPCSWCTSQPDIATCGVTDSDDWKLVRAIGPTKGSWFDNTDSLLGTDLYKDNGVNQYNIGLFETAVAGFNQFLFVTGDCTSWLITSTDAIGGAFNDEYYSNTSRTVCASSASPNEMTTPKWYNRNAAINMEDPWISTIDHSPAIGGGNIVYGEENFDDTGTQVVGAKGGVYVYIRSEQIDATGCPTKSPISAPTKSPTKNPTPAPTKNPTKNPTLSPTNNPTPAPTKNPTPSPTLDPTKPPTPECYSMKVTVIDSNGFKSDYFDGLYTITAKQKFSRPTWIVMQTPTDKTIEYNGFAWIINGINNDILSHSSSEDFPPDYDVGAEWIHSSVAGFFHVWIECSDSYAPTAVPSPAPTNNPTPAPSNNPTPAPTNNTTTTPTNNPTPAPTNNPAPAPTTNPTAAPTNDPSHFPSDNPTRNPTINPTQNPSTPSPTPPQPIVCGENDTGDYNGGNLNITVTVEHFGDIIFNAALSNFFILSITSYHNGNVVGIDGGFGDHAVYKDVLEIKDTIAGDYEFEINGLQNGQYSVQTQCVTQNPTQSLTSNPTNSPTYIPTKLPSLAPRLNPSIFPTINPSLALSIAPTQPPSIAPSLSPSLFPSIVPTHSPSVSPSTAPSTLDPIIATNNPAPAPTIDPSTDPTTDPTIDPTTDPTYYPTENP
eukprot:288546_1